jgi:hypothetical protein
MPVRINDIPSLEELQKILDYDPKTGVFLAKVGGKAGWKIGEPVGTWDRGYLRIIVNGKYYAAHRLAWKLFYGDISKLQQIDHIDGNRSNNAISNLRLANHNQNCQNIKPPKSNTSGFKGVHWNRQSGKWRAQIRYQTKRYFLGEFLSRETAYLAYCEASKKLHREFSNTP